MLPLTDEEWPDHFVLARDHAAPGERAALHRRRHNGSLVTLATGAHIDASLWNSLDTDAQYRARVKAASLVARQQLTFSHHSAAALWRLPTIGGWPARVHVTIPSARGGRSTKLLVKHAVNRATEPETIDGLHVTSLCRTVIDVATVAPFPHAVTMLDAALRRSAHPIDGVPRSWLTREQLLAEAAEVPLRHGSARAVRAAAFADGLAQLPGESLSRVSMLLADLPAPQLQVELHGASGRVYPVDFFWPHCLLIGEFDGKAKYVEPRYLNGRTTAQAHHDEKVREDDLRAAGFLFSRWDWDTARSPRRLGAQLRHAGLI